MAELMDLYKAGDIVGGKRVALRLAFGLGVALYLFGKGF